MNINLIQTRLILLKNSSLKINLILVNQIRIKCFRSSVNAQLRQILLCLCHSLFKFCFISGGINT